MFMIYMMMFSGKRRQSLEQGMTPPQPKIPEEFRRFSAGSQQALMTLEVL